MNGKKVIPVSDDAIASAREIAEEMKQKNESEREITELFHKSTALFITQLNQVLASVGYSISHKDGKYYISIVKQL